MITRGLFRVTMFLGRLVRIRYVILVLLLLGAWHVYRLLRPSSSFMQDLKHEVAERVTDKVFQHILKQMKGHMSKHTKLLILPLEGDPDGRLTQALYALARRQFGDRLIDRSRAEALLENVRVSGEGSRARFVQLAPTEVTHVLAAQVSNGLPESDVPEVRAALLSATENRVVWHNAPKSVSIATFVGRALIWLVVMGSLPLVTAAAAQRALQCESNAINLALLIGYVASGVLTAVVLWPQAIAGVWLWVLVSTSGLISTVYSYRLLSRLEEATI